MNTSAVPIGLDNSSPEPVDNSVDHLGDERCSPCHDKGCVRSANP